MTIVFKWLLAACATACAAQDAARESRTVNTAQGPVRGYKTDEIFEFHGIPYATAPSGSRKFTEPLPGPVWMQPLEAVNKIACPQGRLPASMTMQENCLIANVYMPDTEEINLSVLVHVHGGGYQGGWGDLYTPKSLVRTKKIVGVTFNYRLGAHGFLCLGTEDAPGNAGLKDQVALLRWVKQNIASFGGNPEDVTIAGNSAGSSSVDLLMLSEMTKGLYNKVIPESGSSVAGWSLQLDPIQNAKDVAREMNFTDVGDLNALQEFYKSVSLDALTSVHLAERTDSTIFFVPCVERNKGVETFLEDTPVNILREGKYRKVPVLYGFDNMEGIMKLDRFDLWKDRMNERFSDFLPADLKFESDDERTEVAKTVKEFYFGHKPVSEETVLSYIQYFTDVMFAYSYLKSTELQVAAGSDSIYLYEYSFSLPIPERLGLPEIAQKIKGASHCAQSQAVYDTFNPSTDDTSEAYLKMRETVREMWLNFITTGKPVPEGSLLPAWPPVGPHRSPHMNLGDEISLKGSLLDDRFHFWDGIYKQYHRMHMPPSQPRSRNEEPVKLIH